jgi:uncharacterized protein (DUF2252 family)
MLQAHAVRGDDRELGPRATRAEQYAKGKALRAQCPRGLHARWTAPSERRDPVELVVESDIGRIPELVPLRHQRMLESPFAFYRGAALNMAADLATMPFTGLRVQACGDAHLVNFRGFATPERRIVFDIHDLDETLPAPWEWDLMRLATSFVLACRNNGLREECAEDAVLTCVRSYREHMADYSEMTALQLWYASLESSELLDDANSRFRKQAKRRIAIVKSRTALEYDFPKLVHAVGEDFRIAERPPTIYHWRGDRGWFDALIREGLSRYRDTLSEDRRVLLDRYELKDVAMKVVGVGSVGTMCAVSLLMAGDTDPLFLQIKEARASVLEAYAGTSAYSNHGQRVVVGHRLMQSASDIFLGWLDVQNGRHFYVRQLRDAKIKPRVEMFRSKDMVLFAGWCGHSLARSHARSGPAAVISGYLGKTDKFDVATAAFARAYADQTERDHAALKLAVRARRNQRERA